MFVFSLLLSLAKDGESRSYKSSLRLIHYFISCYANRNRWTHWTIFRKKLSFGSAYHCNQFHNELISRIAFCEDLKTFSCPKCGVAPKYFVADGKSDGPTKRKVEHLK